MTTLAVMQSNIVRFINRGALITKKYSPEILLGVGLTGIVISGVLAAKATLQAKTVLDNTTNRINEYKKMPVCKENQEGIGLTYLYSGLEFAKLYGPSAGIGVLSIAAILSSHGIMKKREVGLIAGYNLIAESFSAYRKRVVEELGPDIDKNYRYGIYETEYTDKETGPDGVVTKKKKKSKKLAGRNISGFAKFFDEYCSQWQPSAETNLYFLRLQQNYANDKLKARGHLFLNEVYDELGLPRTKEGSIYGWIMNGNGTTVVDFGIYKVDNSDFVNGFEKSILLDFNVTGIIWDQI